MRQSRLSPAVILGVVVAVVTVAAAAGIARVFAQSTPLTVVSAGPTGEVAQLEDASEIRVIFSEPMVALGRIPSNPSPPWMTIQPAIDGAFRWSGTTILIFTPAKPLPNATRYTVTVAATATSAAGRPLGAAYRFTFTTPTVQLHSTRWARQTTRFDSPIALVLDFNQRVRPADVLAHVTVRYQAHEWTPPEFSARERAHLTATDPAGLRQFDAKVAAARQTAAATTAVPVRLAADWDKKRFPAADTRVVLETTITPPPGSHLRVAVDAQMPSPDGPAVAGRVQATTAELRPPFFVRALACRTDCAPSGYNQVEFTTNVSADNFARALTVRNATDPNRDQPVEPKARPASGGRLDTNDQHSPEDAGFDHQPALSTWLLRVDPSLAAADGQTLGYPWIGYAETSHDKAFISFGDGHGVWEKSGGPQLPFSARNFSTVTQWLTKLTPADLMPRLRVLQKGGFTDRPPGAGTSRRLGVTPDVVQAHGLDLSTMLVPGGTGIVWATIAPGQTIPQSKPIDQGARSTVVQVTNLGITVKDSPLSTLLFVTRLDTGVPVADAKVSLVNLENKTLWRGQTNRDGVAMAPALPLRKPGMSFGDGDGTQQFATQSDGPFSYIAMAEKDGDVAYVGSDWNEGIEPWEFSLNYDLWQATDILRGSVFTDRGVYKPGEEVHFKAIVRNDTPTGIRLLSSGSALEIHVTDSRNREVDRRTVKVNKWSGVDWTWTVPADGAIGNYDVTARIPGTAPKPGNDTSVDEGPGEWLKRIDGSFLVAAYRRPDFRVDATLAAAVPVAGSTMKATVDARYLFGSGMGNRPVRWTLNKDLGPTVPAAVRDSMDWKDFRFGYYPSGPRPHDTRVAGDTVKLDASGKLSLDLPTAIGGDLGYRYTLMAEVEDVSRQRIANSASVEVYPAPWFIGLKQPDYFADVAKGTSVDVVAVDRAGKSVAGVRVALSLTRVQWNSVRRAEGSGFYTWETEKIETPAGQWTVESGAALVTQKIPLAEGGYYTLTAVAKDAAGHATRTDTSFYGLGAGYTAWERYDHNRITLKPERDRWKPGDTARIMIQSRWETATALLTVEREGIRSYRRFTLTSTQQTVEVPITEADIPNVFVSVLLVRGRTSDDVGTDGGDPGKPAFRLGYTELRIDDASKALKVKVTADREEYRPANPAKVSVLVTDAAGKGAKSEVTLWAVDYGVLSLTGYQMPDVLHAIYESKSLQVLTVDSRQRIVSRRVLTPKGANEGGGGGEDGGPNGARKDFRPLAFWLGSIETGGDGRATTSVKLPESLTTYHIMAVAGDTSSRFGSANAEIHVAKPLMLLPAFPRFLSLGDRATFGGVVTTTLPAGGSTVVTLKSLDPGVLTFEGGSQTITLAGGASQEVRFNATAVAVGTARIQMTAKLGDNTDAFETTLPVAVVAPIETRAAFGESAGRATEKIALPANVLPQVGGLQVDLASTALVGLGEGVRYLTDYPYGCAEQKASRAMALLLASDLGKTFSMGKIAPAEYRAQATSLLRDLPNYQCPDGGFTAWPGFCRGTNVYLTAYVLHVMKTANTLGVAPDDKVVEAALDFIELGLKEAAPSQVQWLPIWGATQAFGVKVLAEHGRNEDANLTRLVGTVDRLPIFALSYLADALAAIKDRGPRYQDVLRRLTNALRIEGDQAHVQELNEEMLAWLWDTNASGTAIVLEGFVRRGDDPVFVQRLVRWLLAARRNGRWGNTHENAWALDSLVAYYKKFEAAAPDMKATVMLGTSALGSASFSQRTTVAQSVQVAMKDLVQLTGAAGGGTNDLVIAQDGTGHLFYTTRLRFSQSGAPPAADNGIRVERRYEKFVENGDGPAGTSFAAGDLVRVTLAVTLTKERRYVAVTDPLAAGFEPVDGFFRTTAADLARQSSSDDTKSWDDWWRRGGFDRTEKYDNRVVVFATRLGEGRHEFSYLVRATTSGTFDAAGTWAEEMYAPDVNGRSAPVVIVIK